MLRVHLTTHITQTLAQFVGVGPENTGAVSTGNGAEVQTDQVRYPFVISDSDPSTGLYLLHYDDNTVGASMNSNVRKLRGTIVDIESGIICSSFGYVPTVISEKIVYDSNSGNVRLEDTDGHIQEFSVSDAKFQCLYDGCLMRVWKHKGRVYHSTHRRLEASNSSWGSSDYFTALYAKYGGPSDNELFDPEKPHSSLCHIFFIVDRSLMMCSKLPLGDSDGFLLYFGALPQYYIEGSPSSNDQDLPLATYPVVEVEWDTSKSSWYNGGNFVSTEATLGSNPIVALDQVGEGKIQVPCQFDVQMANQILSVGYQPTRPQETSEPRLQTGEAVLCRYTDSTGTEHIIRIHSKAYEWRLKITNNQPNLLYRAYEMLNDSYFPKNPADNDPYYNKYCIVGAPTAEEFAALSERAARYDFTYFPPKDLLAKVSRRLLSDRKNKQSRNMRFANIMLCYGLSAPLAHQSEIFNLYNKILTDRQLFGTFVCQNVDRIGEGSLKSTSPERYHSAWDRTQAIVASSRSYARERKSRGDPGKIKHFINENIRNLIMKENGASIYRLVAAYNNYTENKNSLYN
jgi:hypothetical protein